MIAGSIDVPAIKEALRGREGEIIASFRGPHNQKLSSHDELRWGNRGSLVLVTRGPKTGCWYDHEVAIGGDLIAFVQNETGCNFKEAVAYLADFIGGAPITLRPSPRVLPNQIGRAHV